MSNKALLNITFNEDGSISVAASDGRELVFDATNPAQITVAAAPADAPVNKRSKRASSFQKAARIGDVMPDGSIYVGISPRTGEPFFIPAEKTPKRLPHKQAVEAIGKLDAHGHKDWRLGSEEEYRHIFQHRLVPSITPLVPLKFYWAVSDIGYVTRVHPFPDRRPRSYGSPWSYIPLRYGFPTDWSPK
ncbi:MAG: hypothetical protein KDJ29_21230 [Hyphomicrobiales bacterium]|nr:hypothetical protein [Hyphomicrobiales bacterium]